VPYTIILALAFAGLLSACADPMPKLADGLPRSFGPTSDFDKRLHEQFPVGSNESQLTAELKREKFLFRDGGDTVTRTEVQHSGDSRGSAGRTSSHGPLRDQERECRDGQGVRDNAHDVEMALRRERAEVRGPVQIGVDGRKDKVK